MVAGVGDMFAIGIEGVRGTVGIRKWWAEYVDQVWFMAKVTTVPALLIAVPIGATVSLQVGQLVKQLGAQASTGSIVVLGIVREASPFAAAILIAGAGCSAISSDMGARNIRDELDALFVLGINTVHTLVTPRLWAASTTAMMLVSVIIVAGVGGGFVFNVLLQGVSAGAYVSGATALLQPTDFLIALVKAGVFGMIAGVVACYKGMTCDKGPVGVGIAVKQAVVTTFLYLFLVNYVITTLYFAFVPPKI